MEKHFVACKILVTLHCYLTEYFASIYKISCFVCKIFA
nr:MAG TPA: hypothetical protein [Caudoviricetes sp.]